MENVEESNIYICRNCKELRFRPLEISYNYFRKCYVCGNNLVDINKKKEDEKITAEEMLHALKLKMFESNSSDDGKKIKIYDLYRDIFYSNSMMV